MKFWIARNKSGTLVLWFNKPVKLGDGWYNNDGYFILDSVQSPTFGEVVPFPEVTFENSPQEVKLKLTSEKISESIVNEFMDTLNFTYDKSEKCIVAKIHNADLNSLKNIIESKLNLYETLDCS